VRFTHVDVENVTRCLTAGVVLEFQSPKIILQDAFHAQRFLSVLVPLCVVFSAAYIGMADENVKLPNC